MEPRRGKPLRIPTSPTSRLSPEMFRDRSGSDGSTRDAFYNGRAKNMAPKLSHAVDMAPLAATEPRLQPGTPTRKRKNETYYFNEMRNQSYGATTDTSMRYTDNSSSLKYSSDFDWVRTDRQSASTSLQGLNWTATDRQNEINHFASLIRASEDDYSSDSTGSASTSAAGFLHVLDPTDWLLQDCRYYAHGEPFFDDTTTLPSIVRHFLYNPLSPEFTSLQQFVWAILIGLVMGLYTAAWKYYIEAGVDFFWETLPEALLNIGLFSEASLYHYMWMAPSVFGGVLSYIFAKYPFADQNDWINSVHSRGVMSYEKFLPLFLLSTAGMWSGLSLGPELPLILTAGMVGSWLALLTKQSMLQARVLNLTAASAAVGGFFGFPMAGALFVLELPHRMGLQYFESLSPGTIASIVAVLTNRLVTGNDVTGYFSYPFLTTTLPSSMCSSAVVYGFYGCLIGTLYAHGAKFLKKNVHDWFHAPHDDHDINADSDDEGNNEQVPLVSKRSSRPLPWYVIRHEPHRAAAAGILAGALVGAIGIFVPHIMFWGEAQLQNLIDKGRTPLPVFGNSDAMTVNAVCIMDDDGKGFSIGCSILICVAKTIVVGLSLGTGIVGGHFWGPLYVGCAASHLLTDVVNLLHDWFGIPNGLSAYPCVVILCTMGSCHTVTFRACTAIMLILTLTISAFDPESPEDAYKVAGDYSAVFPLLVVSCFLSLMASRDTVFYPTQRCRGDITAVPEVLCRPGKEGAPLVVGYDKESKRLSTVDSSDSGESTSDVELAIPVSRNVFEAKAPLTQREIEHEFALLGNKSAAADALVEESGELEREVTELTSTRLDELLRAPAAPPTKAGPKSRHRRTQSAPIDAPKMPSRSPTSRVSSSNSSYSSGNRERAGSSSSQRPALMRVTSFGDIQEHQPSLMEQARMRAASSAGEARHRRVPSLPQAPTGSLVGKSRYRSGRPTRRPSTDSNVTDGGVSLDPKELSEALFGKPFGANSFG